MAPSEMTEHVGRALLARRQLVTVSLEDMGRAAGPGNIPDIRWMENAPEPSHRRVCWHYGWVATVAQERNTWRTLPYARRQQWYDTDLDLALTEAAKATAVQRDWWWGQGRLQGRRGAVCYVCAVWIYTYDVGRPMSNPARDALMAHRATHTLAGIPAPRLITPREAA